MEQRRFNWMDEDSGSKEGDGNRLEPMGRIDPKYSIAAQRAHVVIMASAGTGKTHQLSNRYLKLLIDGEPVERILATTFTRKAAGEIFERIIERLVGASCDPNELQSLADELGIQGWSRDDCLDVLTRFSHNLHRTRIDTLDAFFSEVARCFSFEMQLPSQWQIVEVAEDARLRLRALDALLRGRDVQTAKQLVHWIAGSEASRGALSVLQAAVDDAYDLFVETRSSGASAWQTLRPMAPKMSLKERTAALDRLGNVSLDKTRQKTGVEKLQSAAEREDWGEFYSSTLVSGAATTGLYYRQEIAPELIAAIAPLREYAKQHIVFATARQTTAAYDLLNEFDRHYWGYKRQLGAIRFDDIPVALGQIAEMAGSDRLAYRLDGWIDHVLLDEFQDTSAMQWGVLYQLCSRIVGCQDGTRTFFCVGDAKQAIYAFRGGTSTILRSLSDSQRSSDAASSDAASGDTPSNAGQLSFANLNHVSLNVSFRSDQAVIDLVNEVFSQLARHGNMRDSMKARTKAWAATFPRHETNRDELPGYACLQTAPAAKTKDGGSSKPAAGGSASEEADEKQKEVTLAYVADLAEQMYRADRNMSLAVLVQTNKSVACVIDLLMVRGIRASAEGGNPLTDSAAVRVALSALKLAEHANESAAAFHVASSPLGEQLGLDTTNFKSAKSDVSECIRRQLLTAGYGDTMAAWCDALRPACTRREWFRVQQFLDLAYSYEPNTTTCPADFIRHVEQTKKSDPTASAIQVMTVHQAKGLGFDRVIVTELSKPVRIPNFAYHRDTEHHRVSQVMRYIGEKLRPALPAKAVSVLDEDEQRWAENALCNLYVSLTRAKHELRIVIGPCDKQLAKLPKNSEGLVRAALTSEGVAEAEQVLFECGQQNWNSKPGAQGAAPQAVETAEPVVDRPLTIQLDAALPTRPSQTPSDRTKSPSNVGAAFDRGRTASLQLGTLMHAWLESIIWLDEGRPGHQQLQEIAVRESVALVDVAQAMEQFEQYLAGPTVQSLLSRDQYVGLACKLDQRFPTATTKLQLEVCNELPIAAINNESSVWGFVDRLVLWRVHGEVAAAHVLEYKTDILDADSMDLRSRYQAQLDACAAAIAQIYALETNQVITHLVQLAEGKVV